MSSISRVGSSFLASSHIVCTQACELRLASFGRAGLAATAVPDALIPTATLPPSLWLVPADTAPGILTGLLRSFGLSGWMRLTNSDWPPNPQVSLNMHQAKIAG